MQFGFVIDNRKCIGCHACTVACKSEHDVPIGVNRTWVKQVEKGTFPHTRRLFSVMRCNHCTDAPCVTICPVEALFTREDGIVDFDNRRCIGCKSCMQACPYDALYIDPNNNTAAKCNYCVHRIDLGLEPACVNVCPEHAIISGDMDNPESEIAQLLGREQAVVRKAAKGTKPNVYYIEGDENSLDPMATEKGGPYFWNAQARGVGHYAKYAEKIAFSNGDVVETLMKMQSEETHGTEMATSPSKSIDVLMGRGARRIYDAPDKGILWGWEVSGYVLTKAISAGVVLVAILAMLAGFAQPSAETMWWTIGMGLVFLGLTGALLIKDLDRPDRFLHVLLRPQWSSWLVKGGYSISIYGGLLTLLALSLYFGWGGAIGTALTWLTGLSAVVVAIYTAFLFAQAKGRDFWQSPSLAVHMLVHSFMAGAATFTLIALWVEPSGKWLPYLAAVLGIGIVVNLLTLAFELITTHPTEEAEATAHMITRGRYKGLFWGGVLLVGNLLPLALILLSGSNPMLLAAAGALSLLGIYFTEKIWVEAPQRIPLT
ncbi:MAG TPA: 4Fe-4S dicluster domain-containing protein [Phaeodactylibacter sp.]|nr:4Fe-4S dicluster domain-containing protein [Phaeodactylibacter sp.]